MRARAQGSQVDPIASLAVATLYGSSACNMTIFFALDLASPGKSIFASTGPIHALSGKCCNFENGNGGGRREELGGGVLGRQLEQPVDELILSVNIVAADPPRLPLPYHVYGLISGKRWPRGVERAKALLGLHAAFDRTMVLLEDVVQVLDRSMVAAAAQNSFLFHSCNRRAIKAGLIGVDNAGLRMRWIAERLAE